jgi:hypothetical protein
MALRRALSDAHVRDVDVARSIGVDPKTVQRWLSGRRPQPPHRWALAELLGVHECDLWPDAGGIPPIAPEIVAVYPNRSGVPREVWHHLFAGAEERIGVLVYSGLFLAEDVDLLQLMAAKAAAGVEVRILLGDPDSAAVAERGRDEGIDGAMSAKIRNALVLHRSLLVPHGAQIRLHGTVLYNSVYRADDEMLVNQHVYGVGASQAPVLRLRSLAGGRMFSLYEATFSRIWELAEAPEANASTTP